MLDPFPDIRKKLTRNERLTFEDGLCLFQSHDILSIGELAQVVRVRLHGKRVYYAANLHLNPTNICSTRCDFCAFSRDAGDPDAYTLGADEIGKRITDAVREHGINEVHIVGGHNPELGLDYFTGLFHWIRRNHPQVHIKALSATEVDHLARLSGRTISEILKALKAAGLGSLPGGGAEIFEPRVRREICPQKITGERWLEIHREAHRLGLPTNATLLYGHIESDADRVNHLLALRGLQDETRGFNAFVPLPYQQRGQSPFFKKGTVPFSSGFLDLKVLSIARLLLDNIPHIKVHWPATGLKFAQAALAFGADDIGGTNFHERVMREAGGRSSEGLSSAELVRFIEGAGYEACLTDSSYCLTQENAGR